VATRLSHLRSALALALVALAVAGCGSEKARPGDAHVPTLRFAGVDLEFALDRIATEAGWVIALDEISPKDQSPDLSLVRVDMDIPAGSLDSAVRLLRDKVGGFDYKLDDGVLYVRSNALVDDKTALDMPLLEGGKFHGELVELVKYIMQRHPSSFITVTHIHGAPAGPPVDVEIPPKASVRDALVIYARTAKFGWVIRRSGQLTRDVTGAVAIMGTTVTPRGPRKTISRVPPIHNKLSATAALADATIRLQTPVVVYDRSILQDSRGMLNLSLLSDPKWPLKETLDGLGESGFGPHAWHFRWREESGVPVVRSHHFLYFLRGRDLFAQQLLGGEFEGSLPELARWINTHQKSPNGEVLMGGEIVDGLPRGKVTVSSGDTVHQAIVAFAKASGVSPYVLVFDMQNPITGVIIENPRAWRGAFLVDLTEWRTMPGDERAMGVMSPEESEARRKAQEATK